MLQSHWQIGQRQLKFSSNMYLSPVAGSIHCRGHSSIGTTPRVDVHPILAQTQLERTIPALCQYSPGRGADSLPTRPCGGIVCCKGVTLDGFPPVVGDDIGVRVGPVGAVRVAAAKARPECLITRALTPLAEPSVSIRATKCDGLRSERTGAFGASSSRRLFHGHLEPGERTGNRGSQRGEAVRIIEDARQQSRKLQEERAKELVLLALALDVLGRAATKAEASALGNLAAMAFAPRRMVSTTATLADTSKTRWLLSSVSISSSVGSNDMPGIGPSSSKARPAAAAGMPSPAPSRMATQRF